MKTHAKRRASLRLKQLTIRIGIIAMVTTTAWLTSIQAAYSQAWDKSTKVLTLGVGASNFYHLDGYYYGNPELRRAYSPTTGQLNFMGEFGIHNYIGLGFFTGIGGRAGWTRNYLGAWNIPIGMLVNFHFYQLIADNTSKNIHSNVLDIYAGLSLGSGVAFTYYDNAVARAVPILYGGPHVGIRYYFAPKVGVTAQAGFGKNIANVGFVFKL